MSDTAKERMRSRHVRSSVQKKKDQGARLEKMRAALGEVFSLSDPEKAREVKGCWSTGFQEIDDLLTGRTDKQGETIPGSGSGFPKGRIVEIYGPEGAAKTSLCLMVAAVVQRAGGVVEFVDAEHALDLVYAEKLGVNTEELLLPEVDTGEQVIKAVMEGVKNGVDLVVCDSIAAITPQIERETEAEDLNMAISMARAKLMSDSCRKINSWLKPEGPLVLFTNQLRMKPGVVFGSPEYTTGGNAMKFYASIRLDLRLTDKLTRKNTLGNTIVRGVRIRARTIKNKVAPPHREVVYDIIYNKGIEIPSAKAVNEDKAAKKAKYAKKPKKK